MYFRYGNTRGQTGPLHGSCGYQTSPNPSYYFRCGYQQSRIPWGPRLCRCQVQLWSSSNAFYYLFNAILANQKTALFLYLSNTFLFKGSIKNSILIKKTDAKSQKWGFVYSFLKFPIKNINFFPFLLKLLKPHQCFLLDSFL